MKPHTVTPACLPLLTGCATQPPPVAHAPGIFHGFWHGLVALPSLIGSLLLPVRVYAFPNEGFLYELGFCTALSLACS